MRNKSTNLIVKTVAKAPNVQLHDRHISISHRLKQHQNQKEARQYPLISERFSNRDKRNEIITKRKTLQLNQHLAMPIANLKTTENLTSYKKKIHSKQLS